MPRSRGLAWLATAVGMAVLVGMGAPAAALPVAPDVAADAVADSAAPTDPAAAPDAAVDTVAASQQPGGGMTVPGTTNEVTGDVLGLGYEQVIRLNGSRVEVLEPVTRGSAVLRSFEAGASAAWPRHLGVPIFYGGSNMADRVVGHSASRLAVAGRHIYVSRLKVKLGFFSVLVPDGSVTRKFTPDGVKVTERHELEEYAVTALDGFVWQGREFLAIGLNKCGVRVVRADEAKMPDYRLLFGHWCGRGGVDERDQITALKMGTDEQGRFLLAAGKLTSAHPALAMIDVERNEELWAKNMRPGGKATEWPEVIAFGPFGPSGRTQVAVGWPTKGELAFIDVGSGGEMETLTDGVVGVARFFTDAAGEPRIAIKRGIRDHQFRSHVGKADSGGRLIITETGDGNDLPWMAPGYVPWSVQAENRSRAEISVQVFAGTSPGEGCWLAAGPHGVANPLPTQPIQLAAGERAGPYVTAHMTRGASCIKEQKGVFYAQVEPVGEPGHRQVVQLHGDPRAATPEIRINEQVGTGRFVVEVEPTGPQGVTLVVKDRHAAPTIVRAPVIEASRLTPAATGTPTSHPDDPSRPVHRFTVSGLSWNVPGASADLAGTTLQLPVAEGSVDGETWASLGTVASPLTPTRDGDRVTLGTAVFDWQTRYGAAKEKDYRYFRVSAGGTFSNVIDVRELAAPAPFPAADLQGVRMSGPGAPRANGLDQTPMRVSLLNTSSQGMDTVAHADLYRRIYYRDTETKALITGLGNPAEPRQLVMFSLQPGQYANEGLEADAAASIGVYLSARFVQQNRAVDAVFKPDGSASAPPKPNSIELRPAADTLSADGTGAAGLLVGSCAEGACALMNPSAGPALHSLTASTVSIQFRTNAVPGAAALPLTQRDRVAEDLVLVSDTLVFHGSRAMLQAPNRFGPNAIITTDLVTHGERVLAENRPVR